MYSRFFVVLKCTVQGGPKVEVLLIAFLQLSYGWSFKTVCWQILGRSGKKIILLSSLLFLKLQIQFYFGSFPFNGSSSLNLYAFIHMQRGSSGGARE